jgi:hypothetical protein
MYFGGFEPQEETKYIQDILLSSIRDYQQVVLLDIHTGYGPRWQMTLVNSPSEKLTAKETATRFNIPLVAGANPDEFYTTHGDMVEYLYKMVASQYPGKKLYAGVIEFGTYGESLLQGIHSLQTTALENCLRWFGGNNAAREWMKHEYNELFVPADPKWWQKAKTDACQAFDGILSAEGYFKE